MAKRVTTKKNPGAIQDLSLLLVGSAAAWWLYKQYKASNP